MIDFKEEAEKLCHELEIPNKVYREYLSNRLEMVYTQGKMSVVKEFSKMRENNETHQNS